MNPVLGILKTYLLKEFILPKLKCYAQRFVIAAA